MLHFGKYLLSKLTYYLIYNIYSFFLKIFIIEHIELVPVNIIIDKLILY